jgi:hypothetical protein
MYTTGSLFLPCLHLPIGHNPQKIFCHSEQWLNEMDWVQGFALNLFAQLGLNAADMLESSSILI